MAEIVPFRKDMNRPEALKLIRQLAADTGNIVRGREIPGRMRKRKINWNEVVKTIQGGQITEGPYLDVEGNWRCNLARFAAGEEITVVVAISGGVLVAITTF